MVQLGDNNKIPAGDETSGEAALQSAVRNLEQRSTIQDQRLDKIESSLASIIQLLSGLGLDSLPSKTPLVNVQHQHDQAKIDPTNNDHHLQQGEHSKTQSHTPHFFRNLVLGTPEIIFRIIYIIN